MNVHSLSLKNYFKSFFKTIYIDDLYLLRCLLCGGFTDDLQDSVMWFSNGGTKSVLHFDAIDNINCLMSGTKELFMVDKVVLPAIIAEVLILLLFSLKK